MIQFKLFIIMTVEQFISILQELPQNAEVVTTGVNLHGNEFTYAPNPKYYENYNRVYL